LPDSRVCLASLRVRGLYRTIIFLPTTLSVVIVGFSWNLILSPLWGRRRGRFEAVGPGRLFAPARVDGLAYLCILPHIKLPLVLPTIGLVSLLSFVGNFNAFDLIDSDKGALAGPNFATHILGTFFDRTFLGDQLKLGNPMMGSAVATVIFFIILAGVCL
jgi:raffinose/stachyose/melibiose transport system permease protein